METPRYRLILCAYLRGLLQPTYPQGIRSRIREELILASVQRDLEREKLSYKLNIKEAFSQFIKSDKLKEHLTELEHHNTILCRLVDSYPLRTVARGLRGKNVDLAIKLYYALKDKGIVT